jgi:hypothetical protein
MTTQLHNGCGGRRSLARDSGHRSHGVPATAAFSVTATGTAPPSYQWNKNGAAISGATSPTYSTPAATTGANGASLTVTVTNTFGNASSFPDVLTVNPAPAMNLSPVGPALIGGQLRRWSFAPRAMICYGVDFSRSYGRFSPLSSYYPLRWFSMEGHGIGTFWEGESSS